MPIIPNKRVREAPEGKDLSGTKAFIGTEFKAGENVGDVFKPYSDNFADKARTQPGVKPPLQGPNEQSIVASGMTVEEWKIKHPKAVLGPAPEDIGQVTTDPPDDSEPEKRALEEEFEDPDYGYVRGSSAPVTRNDPDRG